MLYISFVIKLWFIASVTVNRTKRGMGEEVNHILPPVQSGGEVCILKWIIHDVSMIKTPHIILMIKIILIICMSSSLSIDLNFNHSQNVDTVIVINFMKLEQINKIRKKLQLVEKHNILQNLSYLKTIFVFGAILVCVFFIAFPHCLYIAVIYTKTFFVFCTLMLVDKHGCMLLNWIIYIYIN